MKKLLSLLLAFLCVVALFVPVSAADTSEDEDVDLLAYYSPYEIVEMFPEASAYLAREIRAYNEDISFAGYNIDVKYIDSIYKAVFCENPDLFYVSPSAFETTSSLTTGRMVALRPYYMYDIDKIPEKIEEFNAAADYFLMGVNPYWDEFNKVRYLHDIMAHYVEYELENYNKASIYTAYGALINHHAVCEGYTLAYNFLLSRVGIEAHYIQNKKITHAWSMVQIDGECYHVDVTQDDLCYDNLGRVSHTYCIVSDYALKQGEDDIDHASWISSRKAGNTKYDNAWWRTLNTMIYRIGKSDYFVNQRYGSSIYAGVTGKDVETGKRKVGAVLDTRWYVKDIEGAFWERAYSFVTYDGKYLFFNDANSVYRQVPGSDVRFTVYTKPKSEKNDIYGLAFKPDGYLYITIKDSPNSKDKIYKLDIKSNNTYDFSADDPENTEPSETESGTETEPVTETYPMAPTDEIPTQTDPTESIEDTTASTEPTETEKTSTPSTNVVKKKLTLYVAQKAVVNATATGKVTYSSNKKSVATVTQKGVITAKKKGTAVITAKGKYLSAKITVTVKNPKLSATSVKVKKGKSVKIKIIGCVGKYSYKSSNKKVVAVKSNGKIYAKKRGKAVITVTTNGGIKLKCTIKVL